MADADSFTGRARRVAQVGAGLSGAAVAYGANRLLGGDDADAKSARALRAALGGIKGPLMKVAQMMATIPDMLPPEYADELARLQAHAPPMGWSFVKRRMKAELGADWREKFASFEQEAAHAASLGQVHRAADHGGRALACKLQYPDMASAVESDLSQLNMALGVFRRLEKSIDPIEIADEIGDRLREELDYVRERKAMQLYRAMLASEPRVRAPEPVEALSTPRLLTMTWLEGRPILEYVEADQETRNRIAEALFTAWWTPMNRYGVIHGDPHLGNYSVVEGANGDHAPINLLDFGCIRIFPPAFVEGVVRLYRALGAGDEAEERAAYASWGFTDVNDGQRQALNLWARFIYGPLLDDRVRTVADGVAPGQYGRKEAFRVREMLREHGAVRIPREFVFMDRAAIGLGAAFLHLGAELNFHALFQNAIADFDREVLAARQADALREAGLAQEIAA